MADITYPSPRYSIEECLALLRISRKAFYANVRSGKYATVTDGRRRYMTHAQLLAAAEGDGAREQAA